MHLRKCVLIAATTALVGCGGEDEGEKLRIGALLSTTGALGGVGTSQLEGVRLAAEQINEAGGVLGKKLEVIHRDDATDPTRAGTGAAELANEGVKVVIGPPGSGLAVEAFKSLKGKSIVQIATSATSPLLSTLEDDGYFFRTCPSDTARGELFAMRALTKYQHQRVAVLHMPGAYGQGLAATFEDAFVAGGGEVTAKIEYQEGQQDYSAVLTSIFDSNPQAVLLIAYPADGAKIITNYNSGFSSKNTFWYLSDGLADSNFISSVQGSGFGFAHEGVAEGTLSNATSEHFNSAFTARYGAAPAPGDYTANAYDAVYLAALAMAAAQSEDGTAIRDHLTKVSAGGTTFGAAQFADAIKALEAGGDIDYSGASGKVDLDEYGDSPGAHNIWKVEDGKLVVVEQGIQP